MKRRILLLGILFSITLTGCMNRETREVSNDIKSIGHVTLDSGEKLDEINKAYNELGNKEKDKVKNYEDLQKANDEYNTLYAEDFDKRAKAICEVDNLNEHQVESLVSEYNNLSEEIKSKIQNVNLIKEASNKLKAITAYTEIMMMDHSQVSEMYQKIQDNAAYFDEKQMSVALLQYGEMKGLDYAIDFIKLHLKSPRSFYLYHASCIDTKVDSTTGEWYSIYNITYGATNSFGAEVVNTSKVYSYFETDESNAEVDFTRQKYSESEAFYNSLYN